MMGRNLLTVVTGTLRSLRERIRLSTTPLAAHRTALAVCILLILGSAVVAFCCFLENTVKPLPDDGKGLANHFGILTIFLGSPLLVMLSSAAVSKFKRTVNGLDQYTVGAHTPVSLKEMVAKHLESLQFRRKTRFLYWLCVIIGWYCWLENVRQTINPLDYYGNDVLDSYDHPLGFFSFKVYLLFLWVIIYPVLAYVCLHMFVTMIFLLRDMSKNALFKLDFFHEDGCGGVSVFGNLNTLLLSITSVVFVTVLAIFYTHKGSYLSIWSSVVVCSFLLVCQSVTGVYYIHSFVQQKKRKILASVNGLLNRALLDAYRTRHFPEDLLAVRDHVLSIRSFPYTKGVRLFVNFLRVSPAIVGLAHIIQGL